MESTNSDQDRVFVVVRYEEQWPIGLKREVLKRGLTLHEAEEFAKSAGPFLESEDVVIEREDREGIEAEIEEVTPDHPDQRTRQ